MSEVIPSYNSGFRNNLPLNKGLNILLALNTYLFQSWRVFLINLMKMLINNNKKIYIGNETVVYLQKKQ